jgi:Sodium Bile acid symporter family
MSVDRLINILVTIMLIQMMISIGLGVPFAEIGAVARDWGLLLRAAAANYVCVPTVVIGLLLWFRTPPLIATGFLIVSVCPGASYGPPFTALARGNPRAAVGSMLVLAATSVIAAPLLLQFLVPLVTGRPALRFDAARMVGALLASQLLPLCAGPLASAMASESCKKVETAIRQAKPSSQFVSVWADPRRSLSYVRSNPLTRIRGHVRVADQQPADWVAVRQIRKQQSEDHGLLDLGAQCGGQPCYCNGQLSWHTGGDCAPGLRHLSDPCLGIGGISLGTVSNNESTNARCT